ncbi:MAG: tetratricopeptide repeat protein [Pseudomonadales bacterium]
MIQSTIAALVLFPASALSASPSRSAVPETVVRQVTKIVEQSAEDADNALAALARLLARRGSRSPQIKAFIMRERAALLMQEQQFPLARDELQDTLAGQPNEYAPELRLLLGQVLLTLDDYPGGLEQLELWVAVQEEPFPGGLFLMGYGYLRLDQTDAAIARLEQAIATVDITPFSHWIELLAYAYAKAGRTREAVELLEELIARDPAQERWWRNLASVLLVLERVPDGTAALAILEHLNDQAYRDRRRLARFFAHIGMPADGAELLARGLDEQQTPDTADDLLLLAEMWLLAREFNQAIAALTKAQSLNPENGKPAFMMGQLHLHWEQYPPATKALERAALAYGEQAPAELYYLLAIAHINQKAFEQAQNALARLEGYPHYERRGAALTKHIQSMTARSD